MKTLTIYKYNWHIDETGVISSLEASNNEIDVTDLEIASVEDVNDSANGGLCFRGENLIIIPPIIVKEGMFKFDSKLDMYVKLGGK